MSQATFRAWAEAELDTTVPSVWTAADPDPFEAWVSRMLDGRCERAGES